MQQLEQFLHQLSETDLTYENRYKQIEVTYRLLGQVNITEQQRDYFNTKLFPATYALFDKDILHKDLVYLSLLAHENFKGINDFIEYDKSRFKLNIEKPSSLFDYCMYRNPYWFYEVIDNQSLLKGFDFKADYDEVYDKIVLLKLVRETHSKEVKLKIIKGLFDTINRESLDPFWSFYVGKLEEYVEIVDFCVQIKPNINLADVLSFTSKNNILKVFCVYLDIWDKLQWELMYDKLQKLNITGVVTDELEVFTAFTAMAQVINFILYSDCDCLETKFSYNIKNTVTKIGNKSLMLDILENTFCMLFFKSGNIKGNVGRPDLFLCGENEIRLILNILRHVTDDIRENNIITKNLPEYARFSKLSKYINDAFWRLEIIVRVKQEEKIKDNVIKYMLASPESLIHLCLKKGDFDTAYQIIKCVYYTMGVANPAGYHKMMTK